MKHKIINDLFANCKTEKEILKTMGNILNTHTTKYCPRNSSDPNEFRVLIELALIWLTTIVSFKEEK